MTAWLRDEGRIATLEDENLRMRHALEEIALKCFNGDGWPQPISFSASTTLGNVARKAIRPGSVAKARVAEITAARRDEAETRLDAIVARLYVARDVDTWRDVIDDLTDLIRDLTPVDA